METEARLIPAEAASGFPSSAINVVFALFFATFLYYRANPPDAFLGSEEQLHRVLGRLRTVALVTSSLLVVLAVRRTATRPARG